MSINVVYNKLSTGEPVTVSCNAATYQTLRTGLIKKLKVTATMLDEIGDDSLANQYVQAGYDSVTGIALFKLTSKENKRRKVLNYTLL
jgi:hypothetical protein